MQIKDNNEFKGEPMQRVLFVTNLASKIGSFSISSIEAANNNQLGFYMAANWQSTSDDRLREYENKHNIKIFHFDLARSPFSPKNITAYKQLCRIIRENEIDYIHCNTPVGGLLGRLAGKKCKVKRVIYQVHGFHFYKGAPKLNWMLYYPIEKWLARYTDALVTINTEDYEFAKRKMKFRHGGNIYYVPGVGIDSKSFLARDESIKATKRKELGIPEEAMLLISAGELNQNKNNAAIINAMALCENKNIHYILCGVGPLEQDLKTLAKEKGVSDRVQFLGYRSDMKELLAAADVFVMPSFREGLSRSIMEAMSSGLPCVVSKIRGNVDLVEENVGGYLCAPSDVCGFADALDKLASDDALRQSMSRANLERIKNFDVSVVIEKMTQIYKDEFKGN